jgi:hypothetical protein
MGSPCVSPARQVSCGRIVGVFRRPEVIGSTLSNRARILIMPNTLPSRTKLSSGFRVQISAIRDCLLKLSRVMVVAQRAA